MQSVLTFTGAQGRLIKVFKHQGREITQAGVLDACQVGTRKAGLRSIGQKPGHRFGDLVCPRTADIYAIADPSIEGQPGETVTYKESCPLLSAHLL